MQLTTEAFVQGRKCPESNCTRIDMKRLRLQKRRKLSLAILFHKVSVTKMNAFELNCLDPNMK